MKKRRFRYQIGAFLMFIFFGGLFLLLYWRFASIQATGMVKGHELEEEALSRYETGYVLSADRGKILDRNANVIAEDTLSYRLVAVIKESATENKKIQGMSSIKRKQQNYWHNIYRWMKRKFMNG